MGACYLSAYFIPLACSIAKADLPRGFIRIMAPFARMGMHIGSRIWISTRWTSFFTWTCT
jgi:hypothetical protein